MRKEQLEMDAWLKEVAPSAKLRQWFGHRVERWEEFRHRYEQELDANSEAWAPILAASRKGAVTLLYSARDVEHTPLQVDGLHARRRVSDVLAHEAVVTGLGVVDRALGVIAATKEEDTGQEQAEDAHDPTAYAGRSTRGCRPAHELRGA